MNASGQRDEQRWREAFLELAGSIGFLRTEHGAEMLDEMRARLVPGLLAEARGMGVSSDWLSSDDVINETIVRLCADGGRVAKYVADARGNPWIYLERCMRGWTREQWGTRCRALDEEASALIPQSASSGLTAIEDAVTLTFFALQHCVEAELRGEFLHLLSWLAHNPPQRRSYESVERKAAVRRFSVFNQQQISAITNIVWGGRPRYRETSILAAFLIDADFRPSDSPSHTRAILHFKRSMTAARTLSWSHLRRSAA